MIIVPKEIHILFIKDNFSLRISVSARAIKIMFASINITPAFDRVSYLSENAQNIFHAKYNAVPITSIIVFDWRAHLLKNIP